MHPLLDKPARKLRDAFINVKTRRMLTPSADGLTLETLDLARFRERVLAFLNTLRSNALSTEFRCAASCTRNTLYASSYACLTKGLLGSLAPSEQAEWTRYFDSFQDSESGLFFDNEVDSVLYHQADWWGARHQALHLICAYTELGARPRYPFAFLAPYCEIDYLQSWLNSVGWGCDPAGPLDDFDNQLMNIYSLLQYQRDRWRDAAAGEAVAAIKAFLRDQINPDTGLWGGYCASDPAQRSRMVQFAYHLLPLFFYDGEVDFDAEQIIPTVLATQNALGGYGVKLNASACEDIDSIDLLVRFSGQVSPKLQVQIDASLRRAFGWVLCNQRADGGFVFRLHERLAYGHPETSSGVNESALFPTWFRTLAVVQLLNFFEPGTLSLSRTPGLVFP